MKILWFANNPCGAVEVLTGKKTTLGGWLYTLSKFLSKEPNIELHIAFYWDDYISSFEYNGITYHPITQKFNKNKLSKLIYLYKRVYEKYKSNKKILSLKEIINQISPDIIHIHGTEEDFCLLYRFKPDCPIVVSIQGIISSILYKFYGGFSKSEIGRYESIIHKITHTDSNGLEKVYRIKSKNELEALRNIQNVIGRTFWDKACTLAINPNRKYFEVGEILREEFYNNRWRKTSFSSPLKIITTISGGWYKGIESIFFVANILNKSNFKFKWTIIGIDKDDIRVKLSQNKINKTVEELNINLKGRLNAQNMVRHLTNSDIFVQVSHIENSPNSLGEAMLLGVPIIATFAGGTASMLKNGEEGILIQDGDPYVMAGSIIELSKNFSLAQKMGQKATESAKHRHCPRIIIDQLLRCYKAISNHDKLKGLSYQ